MANLTSYKGNFNNFADQEFEFEAKGRQVFQGIGAIALNVECLVGVFPSSNEWVTIEVDTDNLDNFKASQDDNVLVVEQRQPQEPQVVNNFSNNFSGAVFDNVSFNFDDDGVTIDGGSVTRGSEAEEYPSKIRIFAPSNLDVYACLRGRSVLASKVPFDHAIVEVNGVATVGLAAHTLEFAHAGIGDSFIVVQGGDVELTLSGSGSVRLKGEMSQIKALITGAGNIWTKGYCRGDYVAIVRGHGAIAHSGTVGGSTYREITGQGTISIPD